MSNYLNAVSESETDSVARQKQQRMSTKLNNVATFIETKILKDDPNVSKEIQKADAGISKTALMAMNQTPRTDTSGYDFGW